MLPRSSSSDTIFLSSNPPLSSVLEMPNIYRLIQMGFFPLKQYAIEHSSELLALALSDQKSLSTKAFRILTSLDAAATKSYVSCGIFSNLSLEIVSNSSSPEFVIGRLSCIILSFIRSSPSDVIPNLGFIFHLIPHCGNPSVFSLFDAMLNNSQTMAPVQTWLCDFGFSEYLLRELSSFSSYSSKSENPFSDPQSIKILCIFQLISKGCRSAILAPTLRTSQYIAAVSRDFSNTPAFILKARWEALCGMLCESTSYEMLPIVEKAIETISEYFDHLLPYRVTALTFITKMMGFQKDTFKVVSRSSVTQFLCGLVIQFPNSTILHSAFRDFIQAGLKDPTFSVKIIRILPPFLVELANGRKNRVASPTAFELIEMISKRAEGDAQMLEAMREAPGFNEVVSGEMAEFQRISSTPYGEDQKEKYLEILKKLFN